ncbi:hypothetical protein WJ39_17940 [Burkholderia diffusa]|nr:hypothetical protein WJ39_17940 [Burkholderia diffusa]
MTERFFQVMAEMFSRSREMIRGCLLFIEFGCLRGANAGYGVCYTDPYQIGEMFRMVALTSCLMLIRSWWIVVLIQN